MAIPTSTLDTFGTPREPVLPKPGERSVRAGVFATVAKADQAVQGLLAAGFRKDQITVVCSDEAKEQHFREYEHQEQAGANTPAVAATGGALGAAIGGATAVAAGIAGGGLPLLIVGGAGLLTGSVFGSFLGAMLSRGFEKEAANFYDQAVEQGKLLVTAELQDGDHAGILRKAEEVFIAAGAEPLPLAKG